LARLRNWAPQRVGPIVPDIVNKSLTCRGLYFVAECCISATALAVESTYRLRPTTWRSRPNSGTLRDQREAIKSWSFVMKKFLLGTVALVAFAAPAAAADLAARPYTKAAPMIAAV
jgi:hypothetical protein